MSKRDIELTLQWLENLEEAIGLDALLDAMPNDWAGRGALRSMVADPEPGPWSFDAADGSIRNEAGEVLAVVPHAIAGDEHDAANGLLMSKAPELARICSELAEALARGGYFLYD